MRTTAEFNNIYSKATKVWHTPYFVLFYKESTGYNIGFVAGKKVGNAVHRNRAKRLLRALFIANLPHLKKGDYVLVAKPALLKETFEVLSKTFDNTLKRSSLIL
ncbi:MAG: ribonuclease P protein component [Sulfurovaceae bacterium]|nr:ribonuclease P protein component [Campylobacterales bacterium]MDY0195109.1 ribonuclease P protein component [Sulfurovaceae bacterium]